jgi:hypothetical protein
MKLVQLFVLSALVLFTAIGAHADGVATDDDARILIGGDPASSNCPAKSSPSFHFDITPHNNGGGTFTNCKNTTGTTWIGLTVSGKTKVGDTGPLMFGSGSGFLCNGTPDDTNSMDIFTTCTIIPNKSNNPHMLTFTLTGSGTIPAGSSFFTDLSTDGDKAGIGMGGWDFHGPLTITPLVAAPEPGAAVLILAGFGSIWFWRKRKVSSTNA